MGTPLWWADVGRVWEGVPPPAGGASENFFEITNAIRRVLVHFESIKQRLGTGSFTLVRLEFQIHNYYVFELGTVTVPMHSSTQQQWELHSHLSRQLFNNGNGVPTRSPSK
jgi:hypothetical protein